MIAYIEGKLTYKCPTYVFLDVGGVGYHIHISLNTYNAIGELDKTKLYTYLQVREDAHTLYGFHTEREKQTFLSLISVSGIGATTALIVLSSMTSAEVQKAILNEDVTPFKAVKGVGPKTAKRVILELKDKILKSGSENELIIAASPHNRIQDEALSALLTLGISKQVAENSVSKIIREKGTDIPVEEIIKIALKNI